MLELTHECLELVIALLEYSRIATEDNMAPSGLEWPSPSSLVSKGDRT